MGKSVAKENLRAHIARMDALFPAVVREVASDLSDEQLLGVIIFYEKLAEGPEGVVTEAFSKMASALRDIQKERAG